MSTFGRMYMDLKEVQKQGPLDLTPQTPLLPSFICRFYLDLWIFCILCAHVDLRPGPDPHQRQYGLGLWSGYPADVLTVCPPTLGFHPC